jgi:hypothetical protein
MAYGNVKVDNIIFDNGGADQSVTVSGLYKATTSGVTVSGTLAANIVSGVTVTGTTANFTSGTIANFTSATATITGALVIDNQQQVRFRESTASGTNFIGLQAPVAVSSDKTITLPDVTGTVVTTGDTASVSNAMLATINTAGKVTNAATTATDANTASAIIARDSSGNFNTTSINNGPLAGFRNAIINGNFDIWQRGTSFTGAQYTADRFRSNRLGTTCTVTQQSFTLGQTDVPGEPTYFIRAVVSSVAGVDNFSALDQPIENVRTFAGQQVTFSFWAKADSTKNISVVFAQSFGQGTNSPSASVFLPTKVSIGTSWQKVVVTATVPSISGKTIGNNGINEDCFVPQIYFDAGSNRNTQTDSLGQQSGTFDIAQVQVEAGPVATPFERRPIATELSLCQRYYREVTIASGGHSGVGLGYISIEGMESMRKLPTFIQVGPYAINYYNSASGTWLTINTGVAFSIVAVGSTATNALLLLSNLTGLNAVIPVPFSAAIYGFLTAEIAGS